ncbi:MAG: ABC transporter substrate-binding protein [Cellulosilyticaceae bacterium]
MKFKKLVATMLTMAMVVGISGCTSSQKSTESTSSNTTETKTEEKQTDVDKQGGADATIDTSKAVSLTLHVVGDPPAGRTDKEVMTELNKILKEKVNAELNLQWIEWTDWYTKYNLLFASGEPVDLVITATDWMDAWPNAARGAFAELDELLPTYAPKTWEAIPQEVWDDCRYNDKIMMIPENQYTQWVDHGLYYRGDWAKEFGITETIKNWEEFGQYLEGVKQNKPGVIPWDVVGTDKGPVMANYWFESYTPSIPLDAVVTGIPKLFYGKSYDDLYTVCSPYYDETFVDFAKMMKDWSDKGYWREDALNYKGDTRALLKAGKTGVDQHHTETYLPLKIDMEKEQPGSDLKMFTFGDTRDMYIEMVTTHGAMAVGRTSKNPERALMVYDLLRNDKEVYQLFNYGIEGKNYVLTEDGKRKDPDGFVKATDEYFSNFWGGRMDEFLIPHIDENPEKTAIFEAKKEKAKPYPYGRFIFDKSMVEAELAALSDVATRLLPSIALGKVDDPVKAVEDFREQLKMAGYDKVLAEVQRQMDEFKASTNK